MHTAQIPLSFDFFNLNFIFADLSISECIYLPHYFQWILYGVLSERLSHPSNSNKEDIRLSLFFLVQLHFILGFYSLGSPDLISADSESDI